MESNFESGKFQIDVITTLFPTTTRAKVSSNEVFGLKSGKKSALRLDKN